MDKKGTYLIISYVWKTFIAQAVSFFHNKTAVTAQIPNIHKGKNSFDSGISYIKEGEGGSQNNILPDSTFLLAGRCHNDQQDHYISSRNCQPTNVKCFKTNAKLPNESAQYNNLKEWKVQDYHGRTAPHMQVLLQCYGSYLCPVTKA